MCDLSIQADAITLASRWDIPLVAVSEQHYPSTGEWASWTPAVDGAQRALLVSGTAADVHAAMFRTMLLAGGLRRQGVQQVDLVIPLLPYARSDRRPVNEAARGRDVYVEALRHSGIDRVYTLDLHSPPGRRIAQTVRSVPTVEFLIQAISDRGIVPDTVVLPDRGALRRASHLLTGCHVVAVEKQRVSDDQVTISLAAQLDLGERILILDDALFSGATHSAVAELALRLGAKTIHLAVTHASPNADTMNRLARSGIVTLTHLGTTAWRPETSQLDVRQYPWSGSVCLER